MASKGGPRAGGRLRGPQVGAAPSERVSGATAPAAAAPLALLCSWRSCCCSCRSTSSGTCTSSRFSMPCSGSSPMRTCQQGRQGKQVSSWLAHCGHPPLSQPCTHLDEFLTSHPHIGLRLPVVQLAQDQVGSLVPHLLPTRCRGRQLGDGRGYPDISVLIYKCVWGR